ncbi:hypothetical protein J437_LFUL009844 [Ladona fulva]|uniref:Uncharacterized protein n=1 Tax=Ladona fulva TaxID=123851 RepID=A0A8K0P509_LADFU|nr:hypothetical protein J437_LFUL009844 [Ladona fulva]
MLDSFRCVDIDGPPVSGGWSEWSPWQCSVTCGGGIGRRTRECNNPTPNVFGFGCEGPLVSEGSCNQFPCGTVSPGNKRLRCLKNWVTSENYSSED